MKRASIIVLAIAITLSAVLVARFRSSHRASGASASLSFNGQIALDFGLESLDGRTVHLSDFRGKAVLLNFWATWCQPCMGEIPELKEFAATSKVKVVGIALDEDGLKAVKPFVDDHKINYTVLLGDQEVFQRFNGLGIPYTLVLDRSQRIVKIYRGPATKASLEEDLRMIERGS